MPSQTSRSGLAASLGMAGRQAFEAHKGDETSFGGGGDLPAGIEGGIAQLRECKFDVYKKGDFVGKYFFMAQAVVVRPVTHDGQRIAGLRTSIGPEPLCNTPNRSRKTVKDHVSWVLNEFRKLGVDTSQVDFDQLETVAAAIKESKPFIRFRTWKGQKQTEGQFKDQEPRVQHEWRGVCEFTLEEDGGMADNTGDGQPTEEPGQESESPPFDAGADLTALAELADGGDQSAAAQLTTAVQNSGLDQSVIDSLLSDKYSTWTEVVGVLQSGGQESSGGLTGDETIEQLGEIGDDSDNPCCDEAIAKLSEYAEAAGFDHQEYPTWSELATALNEANSGDQEEQEFVPTKGEVVYYKPINPKTKKRGKAVECDVTAVFEKNKTCTLKSLDDGKTFYKGVKWDELEQGQ